MGEVTCEAVLQDRIACGISLRYLAATSRAVRKTIMMRIARPLRHVAVARASARPMSEIPIKTCCRVVSMNVGDEATAIKMDGLVAKLKPVLEINLELKIKRLELKLTAQAKAKVEAPAKANTEDKAGAKTEVGAKTESKAKAAAAAELDVDTTAEADPEAMSASVAATALRLKLQLKCSCSCQ